MSIVVRPGREEDLSFLREMLYEAAYWRGGDRPQIDIGLSTPELCKLLADWGRAGDLAVIAEEAGTPVGAAWLRLWNDDNHSYGYVSSEVPELGVGVVSQHRNKGIGRKLLTQLLGHANSAGMRQVSLSVERDNPSYYLYESLGFNVVGTLDNALTMMVDTR